MNQIVRVSVEDLDATVEAGVTRLQLNKALRNTGLMFPVDPGADATIGGMAATRASGTTAVRYGTMRENVLGLTVVLADGTVDHDRHARAQVVGRLRPDAAVRRIGRHARRHHRGHAAAASAARGGVGGGLRVRLDPGRGRNGDRDDSARRAGRAHRAARRGADRRGQPLLEDAAIRSRRRCSSSSTATARGTSPIRRKRCRRSPPSAAAAASSGRRGSRIASGCGRRATTRSTRRSRCGPASRAWTTDVCVPISRLADCVVETKQDNAGAPFPICLVGHAGDGNFHLIYVLDPASAAELEEARRLNERMVLRALAMGGTCTGEHGVGFGKMKFLEAEHGPALDVMRTIKRALDPGQPDESRERWCEICNASETACLTTRRRLRRASARYSRDRCAAAVAPLLRRIGAGRAGARRSRGRRPARAASSTWSARFTCCRRTSTRSNPALEAAFKDSDLLVEEVDLARCSTRRRR